MLSSAGSKTVALCPLSSARIPRLVHGLKSKAALALVIPIHKEISISVLGKKLAIFYSRKLSVDIPH
jgi:hypothetical protein